MEKRYQVFVSSTFPDLEQERQDVIQTLMEMDCIPAGMELFSAADEEQWDFIKRVIDDCDYYLIIIGGRYGSISPEGISYTEQEFDYAVSKGIRVVALIHKSPEPIPAGKSEPDAEGRERLREFVDKVKEGRLVKFWEQSSELPGLVALSMTKTIKTYPATGWIRADQAPSSNLLVEVNELRKENSLLKANSSMPQYTPAFPDAADLDSKFKIRITYSDGNGDVSATVNKSWRDFFAELAPFMTNPINEETLKTEASSLFISEGYRRRIDQKDYQTLLIQFKALGLIQSEYAGTKGGGMGTFWRLTPRGEKLMLESRVIRKENPEW